MKNYLSITFGLLLCHVGEPMDAMCEEAGPREPTDIHQSKIKCPAIIDIKQEVAECPANPEAQTEPVDSTPTVSETSQKDPAFVPDGRTAAATPKPGKKPDSS